MPNKSTTPDLTSIFQSIQTPYIVFGINDPEFTIIEENKAHADIAMVDRGDVLGKPLLTAFPDTSEDYIKSGQSELLESIRLVIKTGKPDPMPRLKYDLKDETGSYVTKYWSVTHHPVFDATGAMQAVYQETKDITNEVDIEAQLEKTQHQMDQVLSSNMIGTWFWNLKKGIITTDKNLAHMFGLDPELSKKGLPLESFVGAMHKDDQLSVVASINEAIQTGNSLEVEYRTVVNKDDIRWVLVRGFVEYDEAKVPEIFSGIIIDITDRKEAEFAVTESENRLRFMTNAMPQLVWITRPDGYHEYYNRQWYEYTGTEAGSTEGDGWNNLFHPEDRARALKVWNHSLKTGKPYEIEYRLYHAPTKNYRWVIGRALPFKNSSGHIVKWYGTCTDIDEQKRTSEIQTFLADISKELSSSLDYKKMINKITSLAIPTFADWCSVDLYDKETGFTQVSISHANPEKVVEAKRYRELNPLEVDQPTGIPNILRTGKSEFYPFISDELLEQYIDDTETLIYMKSFNLHSIIIAPIRIGSEVKGGISFVSSDSERYYTDADLVLAEEIASRISLAITNSKLYSETQIDLKARHKLQKELVVEKQKLESRVKERTAQLQLTNQGLREEIVKRREIEKELKLNTEKLARLNLSKDEFISIASHQLRTPATGVKQYVGMLIEGFAGTLTKQQETLLLKAYDSNERQLDIVSDLLRVAQVDAGKVVLRKAPIELCDLLGDIVHEHQNIASLKHQVINYVPLKCDLTLAIDTASIRMVIENLIDNASKYSYDNSRITVHIIDNKPHVSIKVSDDGVGIDPDGRSRLFEKFSRIDNPLSTKVGGSGLGLYWARKIVELHGGTLEYKPNIPKGSTFVVKLPKGLNL